MNTELNKAKTIARALINAGFAITINNGGSTNEFPYTRDITKVLPELRAADYDVIYAQRDAYSTSFVWLVYGNGAEDLVADFSVDLENIVGVIA